jgi:hypothetical protein
MVVFNLRLQDYWDITRRVIQSPFATDLFFSLPEF